MRKTKSWREKLANSNGLPKVISCEKMQASEPGATLAIPSPLEIDGMMKQVPRGKLVTMKQLHEAVARAHHATYGCPFTTGIFAWIAANAADEAERAGERDVTPWWRTLKTGGELNPKYPGGIEHQQALLEAEGHTVVQKGKKTVVRDFESHLARVA